ncbi:MAG: hypothetical protein ACRCWM_06365 [Sarcina sp.]
MNKTYIYNPKQKDFYISKGKSVIDVGIHYKTKKLFWVFDKDDCFEVFMEWNEGSPNHRVTKNETFLY